MKNLISVVSVILALASFLVAQPAIELEAGNYSAGGHYCLTRDYNGIPGTFAMFVLSPNDTLWIHGRGHVLHGDVFIDSDIAISVNGGYVFIDSLSVDLFGCGIKLNNVMGGGISDCQLIFGGSGIHLINSGNANITNNGIESFHHNIYCENSQDVVIQGNTVDYASDSGIYFDHSSNCEANNNTFMGNDEFAIRLYMSKGISIHQNIIDNKVENGPPRVATYMVESDSNSVFANIFSFNTSGALRMEKCNYNYIADNAGVGNSNGITLLSGTANFGKGNTIRSKFGDLFLNSGNDIENESDATYIEHNNPVLTSDFVLNQNYPNPFNPVTNINYIITELGNVNLVVYNVTGQTIATLVNEAQPAGNYSVAFDGANLPSGIYFYKLQATKNKIIRKMELIK